MDGRRIYLLRHGETLYQSEVSEGAIGNGALTERGSEQIAAAALLFRGVPLDRVYASPLARARDRSYYCPGARVGCFTIAGLARNYSG